MFLSLIFFLIQETVEEVEIIDDDIEQVDEDTEEDSKEDINEDSKEDIKEDFNEDSNKEKFSRLRLEDTSPGNHLYYFFVHSQINQI